MAALGVILAAIYLLWMFQKMFLGQVTNPKNENLPDLNRRELLVLAPLPGLIFWIGLYPQPFFNLMQSSVGSLADVFSAASIAAR
ncbi:NADH-quinone oxidoreductase subunit M [Anaerolineaceae bacterium]|nr:NADH-quinone oxidoreductase subunit M [Anaerolineaceae bacterium]